MTAPLTLDEIKRAMKRTLGKDDYLTVIRAAAGGRSRGKEQEATDVTQAAEVKKYGERLAQAHAAVSYKPQGSAEEFCGNCVYFQGGRRDAAGSCSLVEGMIAQAAVCDLWDGIEPVSATGEELDGEVTDDGGGTSVVLPADPNVGVAMAKHLTFKFRKQDAVKHLVSGVVLQPGIADSQGDIMSADDIETAAHDFMMKSQAIYTQHTDEAPNVRIVESFIAPAAMKVGDESVVKGTWMMVVKVLDEEIWKSVKGGKYTGFSIRGRGVRSPA